MKGLLALLLALLFVLPVYAETIKEPDKKEDTATGIKGVVLKNLAACENEDSVAMMATIHTQSPSFLITKQQVEPMFENYDLKYKLTYFKYIGQDGEYAVARIRQLTEKVAGGYFQNNEIDMIQVFKKENDEWKYWSQVIIDVKYI
jgi:hypothetical protein